MSINASVNSLLTDQISLHFAYNSGDIGQYAYCSCLLPSLWSHEFQNWPYIFNQAVFSTWPKSQDKNLNILRTKRAFKMK